MRQSDQKPGLFETAKGLARLPKEHFSVFVGRPGQDSYTPVVSSPWSYYADPFLWRHRDQLWLLVEEFEYLKNRGRLRGIPLDESFAPGAPVSTVSLDCHASFPFLFEYANQLYMVPETSRRGRIDLFICVDFPRAWSQVKTLMDNVDATDTVIFQHQAHWWLITSVRQDSGQASRWLEIYFCDDFLSQNWQPHPLNAARRFDGTRFSTGRNAGGIARSGHKLLRLAQHNHDYYGQSTRVMQIDTLTTTEYAESLFDGENILTDIAQRFSPHHISVHGGFIAFDIRDRVSYQQYVPFWPGAVRPGMHRPCPGD